MIKNALFGHFYLGTLMSTPFKMERGVKYRDAAKTSIIPVKNIDPNQELLKKPEWMKIKLPANSLKIESIKNGMRRHGLHSVCEEASCPNLHECFNHGTATFMILGAICTRRCPFCDVAHGKPLPPDPEEPQKLAETIQDMKLKYVVITSVDRDDLPDRGAGHFAECVKAVRELNPNIKIEILVPDFRGRITQALEKLKDNPLKNVPLGDETKDFFAKWGNAAKDAVMDAKDKGQELYHNVRSRNLADEVAEDAAVQQAVDAVNEAEYNNVHEEAAKAREGNLEDAVDTFDEAEDEVEDKVRAAVEEAKKPLE